MKSKILSVGAALGLCPFFAGALRAEPQVSLDALLKSCEQKTLDFVRDESGKMTKVGESIDAYCKGFLEGALSTLVRTQTICVKDKNTSADFLLSTVLAYRKEKKDNDAASVIEAAFKRAFNCAVVAKKP